MVVTAAPHVGRRPAQAVYAHGPGPQGPHGPYGPHGPHGPFVMQGISPLTATVASLPVPKARGRSQDCQGPATTLHMNMEPKNRQCLRNLVIENGPFLSSMSICRGVLPEHRTSKARNNFGQRPAKAEHQPQCHSQCDQHGTRQVHSQKEIQMFL